MNDDFNKWWNDYSQDNEDSWRRSIQSRHAWNGCKKAVLEILSKPLKNLDLSEDCCDERYIEEIKKL